MPSRVPERINFGKIKEVITPPNLIEIQINSYVEFLQAGAAPSKRKPLGLQAVFKEVFPIASYDGKTELDYHSYEIGEPKQDWLECLREGITYGAPLHVTFQLKDEKGTKEETVFMGELPLMTPQGTFVINGAERVIVSQLHRSPGIAFEATQHPNGKTLHSFRIIPDRGSWYEAQFDTSDLLYVYLDRKKRRRKFLTTTFFRALGYGSDADILKLYYDIEELSIKAAENLEDIQNKVLIEDAIDPEKSIVVARAFEPLSKAVVKLIAELGTTKIRVVDTTVDDGIIIKCLKKDPTKNEEEALKDIYRRLRPGDPPTAANARALIKRLFFDPKRYDLGRVGRYKINQKLGLKDNDSRILTKEDLVAATKYLLRLKKGEGSLDDIDHLGSRRVRTVGELLANQCRVGLARTERLVKERMTLFDQGVEAMTPQKLINPKALSAVVRDFFGRSQLSQFMDQINPLAELTHKRRLSALGPGGLSRDRAGFEVRDVHPSHYGRICPVETPEGPNIGLIASLATFARVNDFGFIETPYRKVEKGRVTGHIDYLTADREEAFIVAQANAPIDDRGNFTTDRVTCRCKGDFIDVEPARVDYMDVSPKQLVSVAAGLIPFLEHDDANRALMGSNMQRQAVPLIVTEAPIVGTGMESPAAKDSGELIVARVAGTIVSCAAPPPADSAAAKLDSFKREFGILLKPDDGSAEQWYPIHKFERSNQGTCLSQRVIVKAGDHVKASTPLADGPATSEGELALGRNILVSFMPWEGYNYEDAILISESVVREDKYTSIHIEEYEIEARDTKLGPEEITRDIPNVSDETLKNLDERGIVYIGAEVHPGDILVGKITPKGESELSAEERLLRAIFGEKAREVRDSSLRVPHGERGIVVDVKIFSRETKDELAPGVNQLVRVYVAQKRKIAQGDKMAGRHGNKGVIARILPSEDMPYMPDGTPVELVLNPLGVPSRMNLGQVLETHLGWAAHALGLKVATPVFDGASEETIESELVRAGLPESGKITLRDGRTGEQFDHEVTVGYIYMLKLAHLVEDKIHARSTGPYSLVTQQPLGGKAQFGGQRFGEMEVWALEAYGASHILQEILTVKSDDIVGRVKAYEAIVKGENTLEAGIPESFRVLVKELEGLALGVEIQSDGEKQVILSEDDMSEMPLDLGINLELDEIDESDQWATGAPRAAQNPLDSLR